MPREVDAVEELGSCSSGCACRLMQQAGVQHDNMQHEEFRQDTSVVLSRVEVSGLGRGWLHSLQWLAADAKCILLSHVHEGRAIQQGPVQQDHGLGGSAPRAAQTLCVVGSHAACEEWTGPSAGAGYWARVCVKLFVALCRSLRLMLLHRGEKGWIQTYCFGRHCMFACLPKLQWQRLQSTIVSACWYVASASANKPGPKADGFVSLTACCCTTAQPTRPWGPAVRCSGLISRTGCELYCSTFFPLFACQTALCLAALLLAVSFDLAHDDGNGHCCTTSCQFPQVRGEQASMAQGAHVAAHTCVVQACAAL